MTPPTNNDQSKIAIAVTLTRYLQCTMYSPTISVNSNNCIAKLKIHILYFLFLIRKEKQLVPTENIPVIVHRI